jgi:uncharacterized protein (DUF433 family)
MIIRDRIEINPAIMQGKPVIRGTRIPVQALLEKIINGVSAPEILAAYPRLSVEDIQTAIGYAIIFLGPRGHRN